MIRIATLADVRFRVPALNLARSLEASQHDYSLTIYCDNAEGFRDVVGGRCAAVELPEIRHLGAKRAKPTAFAAALQHGSVIYLDADAIVLEDLADFWGGSTIRACADDLTYCPFITDKLHPWPDDPDLVNRCYVNSGAFFAPVGRRAFFENLRLASLDDAIWRKYTLDGYLYDNHFLCAFLNLQREPVALLDPHEYGWRGFLREGQLQVRRSGSHLINRYSAKKLRFVIFAGVAQTPECLRSLPLDISTLMFERIAAKPPSIDSALSQLYASVGPYLSARPSSAFANQILDCFLNEIHWLATTEADSIGAGSYFKNADAVRAMAYANPDAGVLWNGLRTGGAYVDCEDYSCIRKLVQRLGIRKVVEIGAGETSILFRRLNVETYSLEYQDGPWLQRAANCGATCLLADFNYRTRRFDDSQLEHYFRTHQVTDIDLLFIDSPVGTQNRRDLSEQLLKFIKPRFILYHDALRDAVNIFADQARHGWRLIQSFESPRGLVLLTANRNTAHFPLQQEPVNKNLAPSDQLLCILVPPYPEALKCGEESLLRIQLTNGSSTILASRTENPVHVSYHWSSLDGGVLVWDGLRTPLPCDMEPDDRLEFHIKVLAPKLPGTYCLEVAAVQEGVTWFSPGDRRTVEVGVGAASEKARQVAKDDRKAVRYVRNPDFVREPAGEHTFRTPRQEKIVNLSPRAHEVLAEFGDVARSPHELFPNADEATYKAIDGLVEMEALLCTDVRCLITGCGRSGTMYISQVLSAAGLRIGHETMRKDGIASWLLAVDAVRPPWGPSRQPFRFQHVLHQVRNPLHAIASMQTIRPLSWEYIGRYVDFSADDPLVVRCAKYWCHWNLQAESIASWRYRLEDIDRIWDELCARLGIRAERAILDAVARTANTRKGSYPEIQWGDLRTLDARLCRVVQEQAARYGYSAQ